jgi:hypothetical protein
MKQSSLQQVFGDAMLHDTVLPLLMTCYDLAMPPLFLFSCADAAKSGSLDFRQCDMCAATYGSVARSMDGPRQLFLFAQTLIGDVPQATSCMGIQMRDATKETHALHISDEASGASPMNLSYVVRSLFCLCVMVV